MGLAELLAALSAAMQAIDLYTKIGSPGSSYSVIQTLNLQSDPTPYRGVQRRVEQQLKNDGYDLKPYQGLFNAAGERVQRCIDSFAKAISDDQLPDEREKLASSARKCMCREIRLIKDFMGDATPKELEDRWKLHRCDEISSGHQILSAVLTR